MPEIQSVGEFIGHGGRGWQLADLRYSQVREGGREGGRKGRREGRREGMVTDGDRIEFIVSPTTLKIVQIHQYTAGADGPLLLHGLYARLKGTRERPLVPGMEPSE